MIEVEIDGVVMEKTVIEYGLLDKRAGGAHAQATNRASVGPGVPRSTEGRVGGCVEAIHLLFQAVPFALKGIASLAEPLAVGVPGHSGTSRLACKQSLVPVIDLVHVLVEGVLEAGEAALHVVGLVPDP